MVQSTTANYQGKPVDLVDFIQKNRQTLVLRPNDSGGDQHEYRGWETDDAGWERAVRSALRTPYVVQERTEPSVSQFPVYQWGSMDMKSLKVDVHPNTFLGKVHGCTSWVSPVESSRFSTLQGIAPTFIIDSAK
jgi:hypothetical protein